MQASMDCDAAPVTTAGDHAAAVATTAAGGAGGETLHAAVAVAPLAKSVGQLGSLDLYTVLSASGASGDFGAYMLDATGGPEMVVGQDVAPPFAVSFFEREGI